MSPAEKPTKAAKREASRERQRNKARAERIQHKPIKRPRARRRWQEGVRFDQPTSPRQ